MTKFIFQYKFHLLLFILSFLILTKFNIDPDLGWHLAYGQKFLQEGKIIGADEFSWTMPGYVWHNSYFLYQIILSYIFGYFGHIVAGLLFGAIAGLAILVLLPRKLDVFKVIAAALGVVVALGSLGVRPHTVSFLMFSILVVLLQKRLFRRGYSSLFWFFFFAIWANFHRGFVVGIVLMAAFLVIDRLKARGHKDKKYFSEILALFWAVLGTFINPFGISIWKSAVFFDLTSRENLMWIAEWQPIGEVFPLNFIFVLTGIIFIYIFLKKFTKTDKGEWFLAAASLFMFSFVSAAFLFYWVAIFIFLSTRNLEFKLNLGEFLPRLSLAISFAAFFLAFFLNFVVRTLETTSFRRQLEIDQYPVAALEFLQAQGQAYGLFNSYEWGGYIDWQAPQVKVFIDGRMPSWRDSRRGSVFGDYLAIFRGNCGLLEKYEIKTVLVKKDFNVSCFENFKKIYEDDNAQVLTLPAVQ